jgi:hypothetical protein
MPALIGGSMEGRPGSQRWHGSCSGTAGPDPSVWKPGNPSGMINLCRGPRRLSHGTGHRCCPAVLVHWKHAAGSKESALGKTIGKREPGRSASFLRCMLAATRLQRHYSQRCTTSGPLSKLRLTSAYVYSPLDHEDEVTLPTPGSRAVRRSGLPGCGGAARTSTTTAT